MAPPTLQPPSAATSRPRTETSNYPHALQWSPPRGVSPQAEPRGHGRWSRYEQATKGCKPAMSVAPSAAWESTPDSPTLERSSMTDDRSCATLLGSRPEVSCRADSTLKRSLRYRVSPD